MSFSPKRVGIDRSKPEMSWPQLATQMQGAMGGEARRQYTETMMFEHYFQNIESQRVSPNAVLFVYEYNMKKGQGHAAVEGKSYHEPRGSPSPAPRVPMPPSKPTGTQKTETDLEAETDDVLSSGTPSLGSRCPGSRTLGGHRRLHSYHPYARTPAPSSSSPARSGGPRSTGPLTVRRLPYAPDRDSQHTMRMPSPPSRQPPMNTPAQPTASLEYSGGETSGPDEGEFSGYGGGETSDSDEGESLR